jgi:prepilin-type processing-associated H-X9-DG protein
MKIRLIILAALAAATSITAVRADDRIATITFVDGHVTEITYDKSVQSVNNQNVVTVAGVPGVPGDQIITTTPIPIGNMPISPLFDNMKLIRLNQTKQQVSADVGQPAKVTRTINADGVTDVWFYDGGQS